jgi:hypothetical protein
MWTLRCSRSPAPSSEITGLPNGSSEKLSTEYKLEFLRGGCPHPRPQRDGVSHDGVGGEGQATAAPCWGSTHSRLNFLATPIPSMNSCARPVQWSGSNAMNAGGWRGTSKCTRHFGLADLLLLGGRRAQQFPQGAAVAPAKPASGGRSAAAYTDPRRAHPHSVSRGAAAAT